MLKDDVQFFNFNYTLDDIKKHCERCGRVCYKSEDKITDDSSEKFIRNLINSKHYSVLEHGTVYLIIKIENENNYINTELYKKYQRNKFSKVNIVTDIPDNGTLHPWDEGYKAGIPKAYITTNYRVIVENHWEDDLKFISQPTKYHEMRYTLFIRCDRGVGEEILRHRLFSYSKESTRYCRYSLGKFGSQITTIIPEADFPDFEEGQYKYINNSDQIGMWNLEDDISVKEPLRVFDYDSIEYIYLKSNIESEKGYMKLINNGWTAQQARRVLPLSLKGDFVMSGFLSDWKHFNSLRYNQTTGPVHPDMLHISTKINNIFKNNNINIF